MTATTNHLAIVDVGAFTVRRTIDISASVERVWSALTEAD